MAASRPLRWANLLAGLRATPVKLRELTAGPATDEPCVPGVEKTHAVCEMVCTLCAVESSYRARLVRIVLEANPRLGEIEASSADYDPHTALRTLCEVFAALRVDTLAFLESQPPVARARAGTSGTSGSTTLRREAEALLAHD